MGKRAVLAAIAGCVSIAICQTADSNPEKPQRFEIRGQLVDEAANAVEGILVRAEPVSPERPLLRGSTYSDDHGEFKLSLPEGRYYLAANPIEELENQPEIHTDGTSGFPFGLTYYPGTRDKAAATTIVPRAGNNAAIVIHLQRDPTGIIARPIARFTRVRMIRVLGHNHATILAN